MIQIPLITKSQLRNRQALAHPKIPAMHTSAQITLPPGLTYPHRCVIDVDGVNVRAEIVDRRGKR